MPKDLILAIDQGTTGSTVLLVDMALRIVGRATQEFKQHYPQPGWVEHDADEIWASVCTAIEGAVSRSGADVRRIACIGLTNQRETSLLWTRRGGQAIHRALVWQDRRTADACAALREAGHESAIRDKTGLLLDPYFSATKLAWVLDHVEGAREAAGRGELAGGTIDTYLLWRLTAGEVHATEPSNASRTLLWPLTATAGHLSAWDPELCDQFNIPRSVLPEVRPSTAGFGHTRSVPHLPDGIPITGIAGDQQAALFGQCCFQAGEAKCTYGTGAFAVLNTGKRIVRSKHKLLSSVAWQLGASTTYCLEGSAFMAGAVVQWLRDGLGFIENAEDIEALARSVSTSDGVVLVPGHAGLGAPHWRPDARGLISGLTRGTTRAHIARAALEGIALEVDELLQAMAADLGQPLRELRVDGGAAANDLLMQIQSDLLGIPLSRPQVLEATAMGAVALAGLGANLWSDTTELRRAWSQDRRFEPQPSDFSELRAAWARAIACA